MITIASINGCQETETRTTNLGMWIVGWTDPSTDEQCPA